MTFLKFLIAWVVALALILIVALVSSRAAQAQSGDVDFTFSLVLDPSGAPYGPFEFGSGSFVAMPAAPGGSLVYTITQVPGIGNCLTSFSLTTAIVDLNVELNGVPVLSGGAGFMDMNGSGSVNLGCSVFFAQGGDFYGSNGAASATTIACACDEYVPGWPQALTSSDPLSAFLAGAGWNFGGEISTCTIPLFGTASGSLGQCIETVTDPPASVREPPAVSLAVIAFAVWLGVRFARRPRG